MSEEQGPYEAGAAVTLPLDTMEAVMRAVNRLHINNIPAKDRPHIETANREVEQVRAMVAGKVR